MPRMLWENLRRHSRRDTIGPGLVKENYDLLEGDRSGMTFTHSRVEHPIYGIEIDLCGTVPLLLPYGQYRPPAIVKDIHWLENVVNALIHEFEGLWENEEDDNKIAAKIKESLLIAVHTNPQEVSDTLGIKAIVVTLILISALDEIKDKLTVLAEDGHRDTNSDQVQEYYLAIFDGSHRNIENIPNELPNMMNESKFFWNCCRKLEDLIPDFHKKNSDMRHELEICLTGLSMILSKDPIGECFSEEALKIIGPQRPKASLVLEVMALLRNATLPTEIQRDPFVQSILTQIRSASTHMRAIFELPLDAKLNRIKESFILRQVERYGSRLPKVFNKGVYQLCDELNDIRCSVKKLKGRFPGDQNLIKWLRLAQSLMDGQMYCYAHANPYPRSITDFKVVKFYALLMRYRFI